MSDMKLGSAFTLSGVVKVGDVVTFAGVPRSGWRHRLLVRLRLRRERARELRQFVVTWATGGE